MSRKPGDAAEKTPFSDDGFVQNDAELEALLTRNLLDPRVGDALNDSPCNGGSRAPTAPSSPSPHSTIDRSVMTIAGVIGAAVIGSIWWFSRSAGAEPPPQAAVAISYASYEDCVLGKLGRGQSTVASEAIIDACERKFPKGMRRVQAAATTVSPESPGWNTFGDFYCKGDCSGHKAGYEWAEENEVTDEGECGGKSQSFTEGCQQWVRDLE